MSIHYLIYVSQADAQTGDDEIEVILEQSRSGNPSRGITGLLIFAANRDGKRGSFMQLLEGPIGAVETLRERIFADPRHHTKIVLTEGDKPFRDFGDWSMAYKYASAEALGKHPAFADLGEPEFLQRRDTGMGVGSLRFLRDFWEDPAS